MDLDPELSCLVFSGSVILNDLEEVLDTVRFGNMELRGSVGDP